MNLKEIKELINLMNENELTEIEIERENGKIRLKKSVLEEKVQSKTPDTVEVKMGKDAEQQGKESQKEENLEEITSPMVGIFYRAHSSDAAPFVEEGEEIEKGQVLCILEAMKVMNEIKSEISGKITKILVENGNPVEYDQPLFLIKK